MSGLVRKVSRNAPSAGRRCGRRWNLRPERPIVDIEAAARGSPQNGACGVLREWSVVRQGLRPGRDRRGASSRRADEPTITSDEAPRPADVIGDEVRTTLIGVANAVTVEFTMLSRDSSVDAVRMVCNHLVNDVWCLVDEALRLNGRSAARSARAVFEHAVTLATVADDAPRAQRYEMHEAIGVLQAVDNGLGENLLERKERDKERRRLARLKRKSAPIATAGTANFGPKFARQWSDLSVYDICLLYTSPSPRD